VRQFAHCESRENEIPAWCKKAVPKRVKLKGGKGVVAQRRIEASKTRVERETEKA
jgi:hypothetical protein